MSAPKTVGVYKVMAKLESTYGTAVALTEASDSIQVVEDPEMITAYGYDGAREDPSGTLAQQIGLVPQGATYSPTFKVADKGGGVAYSASVFPWDTHVMLQAAGFDAVGTFTGGSENWAYSPTPATAVPKSMNYEVHQCLIPGANLEKWSGNGCYLDWMFEVANGKYGLWSFMAKSRRNALPSEVAWVAPTYHPTVLPAIAVPLVLSVGGTTTLAVESLTIKGNRQITERFPDHDQSGAHAGFHPWRRQIEATFKVEKTPFATKNFHALEDGATPFALSFQVGATQYFKRQFSMPQVQIKPNSVKDIADNGKAMIEVSVRAYATTPNLNDDILITSN